MSYDQPLTRDDAALDTSDLHKHMEQVIKDRNQKRDQKLRKIIPPLLKPLNGTRSFLSADEA